LASLGRHRRPYPAGVAKGGFLPNLGSYARAAASGAAWERKHCTTACSCLLWLRRKYI